MMEQERSGGNGADSDELSVIRASIEQMNLRLTRLETAPRPSNKTHPSLDKLNIAEAIADSIFGIHSEEKACTFEPAKPCDHCSMCNTRGF